MMPVYHFSQPNISTVVPTPGILFVAEFSKAAPLLPFSGRGHAKKFFCTIALIDNAVQGDGIAELVPYHGQAEILGVFQSVWGRC